MNPEKFVLLSPNIGLPKVLYYKPENYNFKFESLLIAELEDKNKIPSDFLKSIKLIPILHYKWSVNRLIEKRNLGKRIKFFWRKIKNFFLRKKAISEYQISIIEYDKIGNEKIYTAEFSKSDLRRLKDHAFRTKPISSKIVNLESISLVQINNPLFLMNQYTNPQRDILRAFSDFRSKNFFKIEIEFSITEEVKEFLNSHNFVLFDLMYKNKNNELCFNYHSLVISKNNWNNINIVQATDLHLAKRNDEMLQKIMTAYEKNNINYQSENLNTYKNTLKKRIVNPNELFRIFIKNMNLKVYNNLLDFIFITGDIVDFTVRAEYSPNDENIFEYAKSNWKIFKEILLDINNDSKTLIEDSEELLCPIFTILGNHDYKPWQYDLNWAGIHKKVGLTKEEARALKGQYPASPIRAIMKTKDSLNAYFKHINPILNFSINLGRFIFIFLNSGSDSYKEFTDYVSGSPSLTGITEKQLDFIKNIVTSSQFVNHSKILAIHGPPINTPLKRGLVSRFKKFFNKNIKTEIDQFKESKIKKLNNVKKKAQIDDKFNIEYGTVSKNREDLLNLCYEKCILTISGHTHILNEYRLDKIKNIVNEKEQTAIRSLAVFYDDYSEIYDNSDKIKQMGPFIVQTPALGFKSYKKQGNVGGYREIIIKNSKLTSFKVNYV